MLLNSGEALLNSTFFFRGVGARGAKNRPAAGQDTGDGIQIQRHALVFEHTAPSFEKADELVFVMEDALANHRADDSIEAGAIAAASEDANLHAPMILAAQPSGNEVSTGFLAEQWQG